jgi:endonuclease III
VSHEFLSFVFALPSLRDGQDFFEGESSSLICLETLFNQQVGVERASAAALAIHHYFARPVTGLDRELGEVTAWPYTGLLSRRPAMSVLRLIEKELAAIPDARHIRVSELPDAVVGALASLERYYNRHSAFFAPLRKIELSPEMVRGLTAERFREITGMNFPAANLVQQLASTATLLELKRAATTPTRDNLLALDRIGEETADTLLIYAFQVPALIVDDYLKRILYRHFFLDTPRPTRPTVSKLMKGHVQSYDEAHRLHARMNELGVLFCYSEKPDCARCPLRDFPHRT